MADVTVLKQTNKESYDETDRQTAKREEPVVVLVVGRRRHFSLT